MNCPDDLERILLEILHMGLLRIRHFAAAGRNQRCFIEADHLHNLPALLKDYTPELLKFYWDTERSSFLNQSSTESVSQFDPLWEEVARFLEEPSRKGSRADGVPVCRVPPI